MPCRQGRDKVSEQLEQSSRVLRAGLLTCDLLQGDEGQVSSLRVASAAAKRGCLQLLHDGQEAVVDLALIVERHLDPVEVRQRVLHVERPERVVAPRRRAGCSCLTLHPRAARSSLWREIGRAHV